MGQHENSQFVASFLTTVTSSHTLFGDFSIWHGFGCNAASDWCTVVFFFLPVPVHVASPHGPVHGSSHARDEGRQGNALPCVSLSASVTAHPQCYAVSCVILLHGRHCQPHPLPQTLSVQQSSILSGIALHEKQTLERGWAERKFPYKCMNFSDGLNKLKRAVLS